MYVSCAAELEGQLSSAEDANKEKLESEIKELSDLLPDIDSKVIYLPQYYTKFYK